VPTGMRALPLPGAPPEIVGSQLGQDKRDGKSYTRQPNVAMGFPPYPEGGGSLCHDEDCDGRSNYDLGVPEVCVDRVADFDHLSEGFLRLPFPLDMSVPPTGPPQQCPLTPPLST
jgi:hypothetical protein